MWKTIKIVRSNRSREYYGKYTENGQALGSFAKFLQENGIVAQYTMSGSEWCGRKKKSNFNGHGKEYKE